MSPHLFFISTFYFASLNSQEIINTFPTFDDQINLIESFLPEIPAVEMYGDNISLTNIEFEEPLFYDETAAQPELRRLNANVEENSLNVNSLQLPINRRLQDVKTMVSNMTEMTLGEIGSFIKNYGCFCYGSGGNKGSNGVHKIPGQRFNHAATPVDELDALCKRHFKAQKCLEIDSENGLYADSVGKEGSSGHCDLSSGYTWHVDENQNVVCGNKSLKKRKKEGDDEPNNCKMELCNLEKSFAIQVKNLLNSPDFQKNGDFYKMTPEQYNQACGEPKIARANKNNYKDHPKEKIKAKDFFACCGSGIERRSYSLLVEECCDDGEVKMIGMC